MIDREHKLPVSRQAEVLSISRSTVYYQPRPASERDLLFMRSLDELHLNYPFAGSRMLRDLLRQQGHNVGRGHVGALMKKMGAMTSSIRYLVLAPWPTNCCHAP